MGLFDGWFGREEAKRGFFGLGAKKKKGLGGTPYATRLDMSVNPYSHLYA